MAGLNEVDQIELDAVVVGAGFAGMAMVRKLVEMGFTVRCFERGSDVGGTWYWNRYPGARCDAPSMQYSYQFSEELQQQWHWTETYASQPEILSYAQHVAERFKLREHITFNTSIVGATFQEDSNTWQIETDSGEKLHARFCIMGTGNLSTPMKPNFPGLDDFQGEWYQTSNWPHDAVSFAGKRVGVVGTGSTGIQAIPVIAEQAAHLSVFQRTPQYSTPAKNGPVDADYEAKIKADYAAFRARNYTRPLAMDINLDRTTPKTFEVDEVERRQRYDASWQKGGIEMGFTFRDAATSLEGNEALSAYLRDKIGEIVNDQATAELLKPKHIYGCKRPCIDTNYFETYNRANVSLVDCSDGIECITPRGIQVNGQVHDLDVIVFATGFDAITGTLLAIDITGRDGLALKDKWAEGPRTYLGLQTAGFPNLFTISGPGSPSVLTNMVPTIEQHVNWIADCLDHMRKQDMHCIETTTSAEDPWVEKVNKLAQNTLWGSCDNWYVGANVPGKPRIFTIYVDWPSYRETCEAVVANGYEGFRLT